MFCKRVSQRAHLYVLILFFVPPLGPAVSDEKYVPLARRCALHMVDANSPARFSRFAYLTPLLSRNATNSAKKVTLVVPAVVCNLNA